MVKLSPIIIASLWHIEECVLETIRACPFDFEYLPVLEDYEERRKYASDAGSSGHFYEEFRWSAKRFVRNRIAHHEAVGIGI